MKKANDEGTQTTEWQAGRYSRGDAIRILSPGRNLYAAAAATHPTPRGLAAAINSQMGGLGRN